MNTQATALLSNLIPQGSSNSTNTQVRPELASTIQISEIENRIKPLLKSFIN